MVHPNIMHHFETFLPMLWCRLLLDLKSQFKDDSSSFEETKPDDLKNKFHGLDFVLGSIDSKLSLDYLENLQKQVASHIQDQHDVDEKNILLLQKIIDTYNTSIVTAISTQEKLTAIATCIRELALNQFYCDDNKKAQILLLLLKLLIQNNLSPALLFCMDELDIFVTDTLISAQKRFKFIHFINNLADESILYLENNPFLTEIVAEQLARHIPIWYDLDSTAKNSFSAIMLEILNNKKTFTHSEFQLLIQNIEDCSRKAAISHNPVTVEMDLFKKELQDKNLIFLQPSLLNSICSFAWDSTFGFFYSKPIHFTITNEHSQHKCVLNPYAKVC